MLGNALTQTCCCNVTGSKNFEKKCKNLERFAVDVGSKAASFNHRLELVVAVCLSQSHNIPIYYYTAVMSSKAGIRCVLPLTGSVIW